MDRDFETRRRDASSPAAPQPQRSTAWGRVVAAACLALAVTASGAEAKPMADYFNRAFRER